MFKPKFDVLKPDLKKIVIAVGTTGTGKSTIINMLYNNAVAENDLVGPCKIGATADSVTKGSKWSFNAKDFTLYGDTVGLSDPEQSNLEIGMGIRRFLHAAKGGVNTIIIVLKYGRLSKEERTNLEIISQIFDESWSDNCVMVATHYEGKVNSHGEIDEEIQEREIEKWIGNDEEIKKFVEKIGGRVILTDTSLGRFEEANRPLRRQTLGKLQRVIDTCDHVVGPSPVSYLEIIRSILEKYFGFYRVVKAKERISDIIQYLSMEGVEDVMAGECSICLKGIAFTEMAQTGCNHVYHHHCIEKAIGTRGGPCPMCRTPVITVFSPKYYG